MAAGARRPCRDVEPHTRPRRPRSDELATRSESDEPRHVAAYASLGVAAASGAFSTSRRVRGHVEPDASAPVATAAAAASARWLLVVVGESLGIEDAPRSRDPSRGASAMASDQRGLWR